MIRSMFITQSRQVVHPQSSARRWQRLAALVVTLLLVVCPMHAGRAQDASGASEPGVHYRTVQVDGLEVFYREAGPANAPVILLLHGFPASSHMYRDLIPRLADRYRVIAPDYPGFGRSAAPDRRSFRFSFDALAAVVGRFTEALRLDRYTLYVMDYGAPVGYRLAIAHPQRVAALVVQNGNAYLDGFGAVTAPLRRYWETGAPAEREALRPLLTLSGTRGQYLAGARDTARLSPDAWELDQRYLDRPGNAEVQLDLLYDYRTNVALYPTFQAYFRRYQPPTLIVWGRNDPIFVAAGAQAYRRDLPGAELHLLDAGHFALEERAPEIAGLMRDFLARHADRRPAAPARRAGSEPATFRRGPYPSTTSSSATIRP